MAPIKEARDINEVVEDISESMEEAAASLMHPEDPVHKFGSNPPPPADIEKLQTPLTEPPAPRTTITVIAPVTDLLLVAALDQVLEIFNKGITNLPPEKQELMRKRRNQAVKYFAEKNL